MRLIDEDVLAEIIYNKWSNKEITDTKYNTFLALLDEVPTIDPVRHGKWIKRKWYNEILDTEFNGVSCSVCGELINQDTFYGNNFNYCPNCGSRNREERKNEHK